jgi:hypothetical protein
VPALFVMRAQSPAPCAIHGMASLNLVLGGRTGKVFNLAGCAEGGDDLCCTPDYSIPCNRQGCRYRQVHTAGTCLCCLLQVFLMSLQVGLDASDRACDTTPLSSLACPVPGDQHCIRKTKHAAGPRLCTQPLPSLPFLFLHSLSKVCLYIRLCGVWSRSRSSVDCPGRSLYRLSREITHPERGPR